MSRALLQQALDALTYQGTMGPTRRQRRHAAITALQAALAQPAPEPVGWLYDWHDDSVVTDWFSSDYEEAHCSVTGCHNIRPLYTQPIPAKSLTDERVVEIRKECYGGRFGKQPTAQWGDSLRFARAIESAHGIRPAPEVRRARPDDTEGGEI